MKRILSFLLGCSILSSVKPASADSYTANDWTAASINLHYPALVLALAKVESNFDMSKAGRLGERGALQLRPEFHGIQPLLTEHLEVADAYLVTLEARCRPRLGEAWFICFNYGPTKALKLKGDPKKTKYFKKVEATLNGDIKNRWPLLPYKS